MHLGPAIEGFGGVFATESDYCDRASRVSRDELGDIKHIAVDHNPTVIWFIMLRDNKAC